MSPFQFSLFVFLKWEFPPKLSQSFGENKTLLGYFQTSCQSVFSGEQSYKWLCFCAFCSFKNHKPVPENRTSPGNPRAGKGGLWHAHKLKDTKLFKFLIYLLWAGWDSVQVEFRNHVSHGNSVLNSVKMWYIPYMAVMSSGYSSLILRVSGWVDGGIGRALWQGIIIEASRFYVS